MLGGARFPVDSCGGPGVCRSFHESSSSAPNRPTFSASVGLHVSVEFHQDAIEDASANTPWASTKMRSRMPQRIPRGLHVNTKFTLLHSAGMCSRIGAEGGGIVTVFNARKTA